MGRTHEQSSFDRSSRRSFLGRVGAGALAVGGTASLPAGPAKAARAGAGDAARPGVISASGGSSSACGPSPRRERRAWRGRWSRSAPRAASSTPANGRTPSFDLDSVYGAGPVGSAHLDDPADRAKLKVESGGLFEDVPQT